MTRNASINSDQFSMFWARCLLLDQLGNDVRDVIEPDAYLVDDIGADSLDMCDLQSVLLANGLAAPDGAFTTQMRVKDFAALLLPTINCTFCEGSKAMTDPRDNAGDPDAREVLCDTCDGTGVEDIRPNKLIADFKDAA